MLISCTKDGYVTKCYFFVCSSNYHNISNFQTSKSCNVKVMKKSLYLLFLKCPHTIHYTRPYVLEKKDSVIYVIEYQKRNY